MSEGRDEKKYWLDDSRNVNKLVYALYVACALLIAADFFIHKHASFPVEENIPAFYAIVGFVAFVAIVRGGMLLRKLVMRDKDYYDV